MSTSFLFVWSFPLKKDFVFISGVYHRICCFTSCMKRIGKDHFSKWHYFSRVQLFVLPALWHRVCIFWPPFGCPCQRCHHLSVPSSFAWEKQRKSGSVGCRCFRPTNLFVCEGRGLFGRLEKLFAFVYFFTSFLSMHNARCGKCWNSIFLAERMLSFHTFIILSWSGGVAHVCVRLCVWLSPAHFCFFAWFRFCQCVYFHSCAIVCGGGVVRLVGVPWGTYSIHHTIRANKEITTNGITKEKL